MAQGIKSDPAFFKSDPSGAVLLKVDEYLEIWWHWLWQSAH